MSEKEVKASIDKLIEILSEIKDWEKEKIEKTLLEKTGESRGELLWPLRVALSGKKASAPPFDIAAILGREETLKRLQRALSVL